MFKNDEYSGMNVLFIPNYTVSALEANGKTLSDLENVLLYAVDDNKVGEQLKSMMSRYDLIDFYVVNMLLNNVLVGEDSHGSMHNFIKYSLSEISGYNTFEKDVKERYLTIINNLSKKDSILVSENKQNETYEFKVCEKTLFVVLHDGFSDYVINVNNVDRDEFIRVLVNKMFNVFGEEQTLMHSMLHAYVKYMISSKCSYE